MHMLRKRGKIIQAANLPRSITLKVAWESEIRFERNRISRMHPLQCCTRINFSID